MARHSMSGTRFGDLLPAAAVAILLVVIVGCDKDTPVGATSAEPGVILADAEVTFQDPPLGEESCQVCARVRNGTDKILTAIVVTAFNLEGNAIATASAESFGHRGFEIVETVRPGETGGFCALLSHQERPLRTCNGITRVELTEAIFE